MIDITDDTAVVPTILLAAASGARTMTGVAATAKLLATPRIAGGAAALAAIELVADKLPFLPDRTEPGPLFGRIVAGGAIGIALASATGNDKARGALIGAAAAFAGAFVGFHARRLLADRMDATAAALVEDAAVGALAAAGARAMPKPRSSRFRRRRR